MKQSPIAIVLVLCGACATHRALPESPPVVAVQKMQNPSLAADAASYSAYMQPGTATVAGQLFFKAADGNAYLGAGESVYLDPVTPYSSEWFSHYGRSVAYAEEAPSDKLFRTARKLATADAGGRFTFNAVPAGRYYVRGRVRWHTTGHNWQSELLADSVDIAEGQTKKIVLSNR